jgi:predicted ArsR family transcriptional regulator
MTDHGRERFEHSYDDLAVLALRFIASKSTDGSVKEFASQRAKDIENRALEHLNGESSMRAKSEALADFLTLDGYASTVTSTVLGEQLCQHHCPVVHVAAAFPELCEAETQSLSNILGTHVQRLATIAHGDGVCTTFIPRPTKEKTKTGVRA